ncbi:hypothetical protein [Geoanaerobacter pelophilus]|nr:hypothetical protein [Geoanaerobacter pelophilus]
MLSESLTTLITALKEMPEYKTVDIWEGDVESLINKPQTLPSAHLILSKCGFSEPNVIGGTTAPAGIIWSLIIMSKNLRSKSDGAVESLALIEATAAKLFRLNTGFGFIQPDEAQLVGVQNGVASYGMYLTQEYNP